MTRTRREFNGGPWDGEVHEVPTEWGWVVVPPFASFGACSGLPMQPEAKAKKHVRSSTCGLYQLQATIGAGARMVWRDDL